MLNADVDTDTGADADAAAGADADADTDCRKIYSYNFAQRENRLVHVAQYESGHTLSPSLGVVASFTIVCFCIYALL